MALGFGFNKQKILASAEKAVQQGKLQSAINEYEKVVQEDPKDLNILNTIGDLHARVGNNDKAAVYFSKDGDIYARSQYLQVADASMKAGNLEEAARIFQKILELDSDNTAMQTKLADLYIKLGRKDNARDIFLTAANSLYQRGAVDAADEALRRVS